ncbi:sodium:proton antiporter [Helicobacter didelphidarum]|uniref:Sodium:proton antiporter n=1 Tax=Helicobacter didelphidarum TaxID=2040648 RepID=A0A3D8IP22_9HELI|nr:cation:proton antiporter [Helicobacter didelphidarum]RDU66999.1 sodium:proton antiporter [Helicobacter didelphidarum]
MHDADLISFSIVAVLIVIAPSCSRITRIPVAVIEIILGAIACYSGLFQRTTSLEVVAHVSFLYLMLLAGMEVDLRGFSKLGKVFYRKAVLYFISLYGLAVLLVLVFDLEWIYIAVFPVMSLGMIVTLLRDYGKNQEWLNIALKIGIVGELVSITALVVVQNGYAQGSQYTWSFYKALVLLGIFVLAFVLLFRIGKVIFWWKPTIKLWFMPNDDSNNQDIRFSFMLFFVLIGVATLMGIEDVLGAFLAGMVVATFFAYKYGMVHKLNDIGFGFFVPLFFIYVGSTLNLQEILHDINIVLHGIYISCAMLLVRLISASIAFGSYFKSLKNTSLFALSDCMPLTFLVAIATLGLKIEAINQSQYYSLIIAAIFEGIFFTIFIKIIYHAWKEKKQK